MQVKKSSKSKGNSDEQNQPNLDPDPDPLVYRELDTSDLPSQYTEDIETFRQILKLPDPRGNMPMSSITVWDLNDVASQQELRPKGPSAMLPISPPSRLLIYLRVYS